MTNTSQNGDSQSPSIKPQLQHCFMAGIRFDTEVEYLDEQGRWKPLCSEPDEVAIRATADQANTSLLQHINDLLQSSPQALPDTMQEWQEWIEEIGGHYHARMIQGPLHALAQPLLKGLSSDGAILVQLALPKDGKRWMLVTGVECEHSAFGPAMLRSLLVLDQQVPALWGGGHNARVSLPSKSQSDAVGLQNKLCIYRTLDGGYLACTVQRMVVIRARA